MKLFHTPTSPFVRKVTLTLHETGLASRVETEFLRPAPVKADASLSRVNPLNKIPALVLDDGGALYDSAVICEYLDTLHDGPRLVPASGDARWRVLRLQALCDGVLEAGVAVFYEKNLRPRELWWQPWLDGQAEKASQGLDALEREAASFGDRVDLAQICAAATLGWLEFRQVLGDPFASRPALSAWFRRFSERPSMKATVPHA